MVLSPSIVSETLTTDVLYWKQHKLLQSFKVANEGDIYISLCGNAIVWAACFIQCVAAPDISLSESVNTLKSEDEHTEIVLSPHEEGEWSLIIYATKTHFVYTNLQ